MPFHFYNGIKYYTFSSFGDEIKHGIFTRNNGVSPDPWCSLNIGGTVGDDPNRVEINRKRVFEALGLNIDQQFDVWQVHGTNVVHAERPRNVDEPHQKADIILTKSDQVSLVMRFADCMPILLYEPEKKVIGIVHAGWKGTVSQAALIAVNAMVTAYGCTPNLIQAGLGPSIGPDHYVVGELVAGEVRKVFGNNSDILAKQNDGNYYFDLWQANFQLLNKSGVNKIECAKICTACHLEDWFSHRAEKGKTGRFGAVISLEAGDD